MSLLLNGTDGVTYNDGTLQSSAPVGRNRIINGNMTIDQRNAGASVTPTASATYVLDRWNNYLTVASKYSVQQNAGAVTPPAGFTNYLGATSLSAYSVTSSDLFVISQSIEGYNVADLAWGTANAKTITLSFWVRSSLTGTFGGSIQNSSQGRSYPYTYTISVANTWEQKSITIPGDTSGTWLTTNGNGLWLFFNLGTGTTGSGTAGAWSGGNYQSATGATSVVGTSGATFYITGVQLEVGSTATDFEHRLWHIEKYLCERYCQTTYPYGTAPGTNIDFPGCIGRTGLSGVTTSGETYLSTQFKQQMRASPTILFYDAQGNAGKITGTQYLVGDYHNITANVGASSTNGFAVTQNGGGTFGGISYHYLVTAEL